MVLIVVDYYCYDDCPIEDLTPGSGALFSLPNLSPAIELVKQTEKMIQSGTSSLANNFYLGVTPLRKTVNEVKQQNILDQFFFDSRSKNFFNSRSNFI